MMILAALLLIISVLVFACSLCRIPSRALRSMRGKSLVLDSPAAAGRLGALLRDGDTESVFRVLKALQQRGDVDIIETESEIYVSGHQGVAAGEGRRITRGLLVADYHPVEDFRHLRVLSGHHPGARIAKPARGCQSDRREKPPAAQREESRDHLFASDYDVRELLENLTARPGGILPAQMPS